MSQSNVARKDVDPRGSLKLLGITGRQGIKRASLIGEHINAPSRDS
jgi:hypothetical protein